MVAQSKIEKIGNLLSNILNAKKIDVGQGFNPTFAIRTKKQLFLGIHRQATLEFKGMIFQNGL